MATERRPLVWVLNDPNDPAEGSHLDHGDYETPATEQPEPTLEQYADYADEHAEAANFHAFVGVYRILATILCREFGRGMATRALRIIAEYDGIHEMLPSALGLPDNWNEWTADAE